MPSPSDQAGAALEEEEEEEEQRRITNYLTKDRGGALGALSTEMSTWTWWLVLCALRR
jgi:hypothetical protein